MLAAGLVLLPLAGGCADATEQYCAALREQESTLEELAGSAARPDADVLGDSLAVYEELEAQAPDDVVDEWDTVVFALRTLEESLDRAGVRVDRFRPGERPAGVSGAEFEAVENAAEELRSEPVADAGRGIEQHAIDVCQVDLSL